jgi:hypothetical protein
VQEESRGSALEVGGLLCDDCCDVSHLRVETLARPNRDRACAHDVRSQHLAAAVVNTLMMRVSAMLGRFVGRPCEPGHGRYADVSNQDEDRRKREEPLEDRQAKLHIVSIPERTLTVAVTCPRISAAPVERPAGSR